MIVGTIKNLGIALGVSLLINVSLVGYAYVSGKINNLQIVTLEEQLKSEILRKEACTEATLRANQESKERNTSVKENVERVSRAPVVAAPEIVYNTTTKIITEKCVLPKSALDNGERAVEWLNKRSP